MVKIKLKEQFKTPDLPCFFNILLHELFYQYKLRIHFVLFCNRLRKKDF